MFPVRPASGRSYAGQKLANLSFKIGKLFLDAFMYLGPKFLTHGGWNIDD